MLGAADAWLGGVYSNLAQAGCLVLLDEVSLFHDEVARRFSQSPVFQAANAAYVTITPFDHAELMEDRERKISMALGHQLQTLLNRYGVECDPECEFGVEDEPRLRRWLHGGMPRVIRRLVGLAP